MSLTLITGPMFAGKTKTMVDEIVKYIDVCSKHHTVKALIVNSVLDTRDNFLSSHHSNFTAPQCEIRKVSKLSEISDFANYNIIGVDEIQFYNDLYDNVSKWRSHNIHVYCAGLSSSFEMKSFSEIEKLYPIADVRKNVFAVCYECLRENPLPSPSVLKSYRASFNKRVAKSKELILVGDEDLYTPVCWKHFNN